MSDTPLSDIKVVAANALQVLDNPMDCTEAQGKVIRMALVKIIDIVNHELGDDHG